jgi:hypothetical protein
MSGFFGMLRLDGEPIRESLLKEIAEELRFRGPDGVNVCFDGAIGGCFARMRTGPEKQAETQAVVAGGRFRLWGGIRLDGRKKLRQELGEKGSRVSEDASVKEYFLEAWQTWGPAALERIIDDFSLALPGYLHLPVARSGREPSRNSGGLPKLTPTWEKRFLPLDGVRGKFEKRSLGLIYVLCGAQPGNKYAANRRTAAERGAARTVPKNLYELALGPRAPRGRV